MKKNLLVGSVAALVIWLAAGSVSAQKSTIIQKIIVKVNGEIFTQGELEFRQVQALRDQSHPVIKAEDLTSDPGLRAALAEVTPSILMEAVDELMLVQHGREIGVKFTEERFKNALDELKKSNNITDEAAFQTALKGEGITLADLRINIERAFIIQNVTQKELMRSMTLTEEEARQYYAAHPDEFMKPASVTLREIFVGVPTETIGGQASVNVAADEAAKQKIAAARERAQKGEDFVKLVTETSESGTKANGGLIGPVLTADLAPAVGQILDKLKPGEMTEPLRTKTGYQLIKLESRDAAGVQPFEKSRDQIGQKILESRLEVEKAKFLDKLRTQAIIEWKDDSYKKLYDTALAARAKSAKGTPGAPGR